MQKQKLMHAEEYYPALKEGNPNTCYSIDNPEDAVLGEIKQTQDKYYDSICIRYLE